METVTPILAAPLGTLTPVRPWRPAPFGPGRSPYDPKKSTGKVLGAHKKLSGIFDDPLTHLGISATATILAAAGTAQFTGWMRILSWAVVIGSGAQTIANVVALFKS